MAKTLNTPRGTDSYDVAIVGGGPVSAVLLNLLEHYGLRAIAFERENGIYHLPRAVGCDGEVVRLLQSLGLHDWIQRSLRPSHGMTFENSAGQVLLDWTYPPDYAGPDGWAAQYTYHQPDLESELRRRIGQSKNVELLTGHEVVEIVDHGTIAELLVRDIDAGTEFRVEADWVIGADGANSLTRSSIDARYRNLGPSESWIVVDVILGDGISTPEKSVQYCWPSRPHMYLRLPGARRRWEFMLLPGEDPAEMIQPTSVWKLLDGALHQGEGEIERATVYRFRSMISDTWREGRILLAGDSAHLQPPMLAQGLCSGMRDAANLAWKLAAIQTGHSGTSLLDAYERERAPHVEAWINEATRLAAIVQTTDEAVAQERDKELLGGSSVLRSIRPPIGIQNPTDPLVGTICPQVVGQRGERSDDRVGLRFAVLCREEVRREVLEAHPGLAHGNALVAPVRADDFAAEILDRLDRDVVVMRPDRYIASTARSGESVEESIRVIGDWLGQPMGVRR